MKFVLYELYQVEEQYFIAFWRIYYEEGIYGTQLKEAEEIRSYYSIHSDNQQWINYGCVSAGKSPLTPSVNMHYNWDFGILWFSIMGTTY